MGRHNRKDNGLFDVIAEVSEMLFGHLPTGWSLPMAACWLLLGAWSAGKCAIPILTTVIFVMLGAVPAIITLLAAWKAARKKGKPFLTFGSGKDAEYEAHLDATFGISSRPSSRTTTPAQGARPWTRATGRTSSVKAPDIDTRVELRWSLELLRALEWRRFELLIEGLFRGKDNWRAEGGPPGADGGIDVLLYQPGETRPTAMIQCKAWREKQVGVATVRELFGIMAAENIGHGMIFTCGEFSADAEKFAENKSIDLVNGARLLSLIEELPAEARITLLSEITAGDYTTPTCPSCRVKLVRRSGARGEFWGCINFPRCRTVING